MNIERIKSLGDETIRIGIAESGAPGARFLALARDGSVIYSGNAGKLSQTSDQPITNETVFWAASATKVLTAICAVKLVDLGLISLDANVLPYLPDLEKQQVREGFMTPGFKLVDREGQITLRQLLSFTSGVSYPVLESNAHQMHTIPTGTEPFINADRTVYVGPLECQPGTKWAYSGGADWAGELVEKLSDLKLSDFMQKHLLGPCGIDGSGITFRLTAEQRKYLAGSHFRWPDGKVTPRGKIYSDEVNADLGGMGAYATADAFGQVLLPLINEGRHPKTGNQILKPELVKEMFRPQLNEQQRAWLDLPTPANMMQVIMPGMEKQWGLGFLLFPKGTSVGRGAYSGTWAGLANTHWMVDPKNGVLTIVFAQLIPQEDPRLLAVRDEWEKIIYANIGVWLYSNMARKFMVDIE
ncbi:beta-lactamase/transpeptidase-like protein [Ramaria rubella]|nr:beta-lactamase/transpeptidase-like protein [Ramaria rubella]